MPSYVHHVPGRLRVRVDSLKKNKKQSHAVRQRLETLAGVNTVVISTVTGSVVVTYSPAAIDADEIIKDLAGSRDLRNSPTVPTGPGKGRRGELVSQTTTTVAKTLAGVVAKKLLERSAYALIGAIL